MYYTLFDNIKSYEFYEEPPPNNYISLDFKDPFPPTSIIDLGIDRVSKSIQIFINNNSLEVCFTESILNREQVYFLFCNIMWELKIIEGYRIDNELDREIESIKHSTICRLAHMEGYPGKFGQKRDILNEISPEDFGLLKNE